MNGRIAVICILVLLVMTGASGHEDALPHPHDEAGEPTPTSNARDWFFFGFGLLCGAVAAWAITRDHYQDAQSN